MCSQVINPLPHYSSSSRFSFSKSCVVREQKQADRSLSLLPHTWHVTAVPSNHVLALHPARDICLPSKQKAGPGWVSVQTLMCRSLKAYWGTFLPLLNSIHNELAWEEWYATSRSLRAASRREFQSPFLNPQLSRAQTLLCRLSLKDRKSSWCWQLPLSVSF